LASFDLVELSGILAKVSLINSSLFLTSQVLAFNAWSQET